jgi:hypothetical protein
MKANPTFALHMLRGACKAGRTEAIHLFDPDRQYTLKEVFSAGASDQNVAWMLSMCAQTDEAALKVFSAWAKSCAEEQGLKRAKVGSAVECSATISASMRAWAKNRPTSKGARAWAYAKLREMINSEGT